MRLMTGYVRASAYDRKVRRVLFALLKGKVSDDEILRASAEFNKKLFELLQKEGIDKRDVIRITCDFTIEDSKVNWKWDSLKLEHYEEAKEIGARMSTLLQQLERQEQLVDEFFEKLSKLADKVRGIAQEIDDMIEDLKRKRELTGSQ
ncbi:MAG: single- stranded DNA-binding family protein [Candidatus Njordarchaeales archaeon]